jgi:hypothetical protein
LVPGCVFNQWQNWELSVHGLMPVPESYPFLLTLFHRHGYCNIFAATEMTQFPTSFSVNY